MNSEWPIASSEEAVVRMQNLRALTPHFVDDNIVEWARLLSLRMMGPQVDSNHFVITAGQLIPDLIRGVSGFYKDRGLTIESPLTGRTVDVYQQLYIDTYRVAQIVFPPEFAQSVRDQLVEYKLGSEEDADFDTPEDLDTDRIETNIDNVEQAKISIFDDAKKGVMALDWNHFGIAAEKISQIYDIAAPALLRQAELRFQFNFLVSGQEPDDTILLQLPEQRKLAIGTIYWLALLKPVLSGAETTFTRDFLWHKIPEIIARTHKLDYLHVYEHFSTDRKFRHAHRRAALYMVENGLA